MSNQLKSIEIHKIKEGSVNEYYPDNIILNTTSVYDYEMSLKQIINIHPSLRRKMLNHTIPYLKEYGIYIDLSTKGSLRYIDILINIKVYKQIYITHILNKEEIRMELLDYFNLISMGSKRETMGEKTKFNLTDMYDNLFEFNIFSKYDTSSNKLGSIHLLGKLN